MKQATRSANAETYILTQLELYNWGGFQGLHQADIDPAGTAIIGPTGSGKTTLVDALMTLLCANPRYNLASSGGHESDRDLVSYVRGVSGSGNNNAIQSHSSRTGKTITGIAATFMRGEQLVRLGTLLWFEGTSSTAVDMKKQWLFSENPQQTLELWINTHHEGGMRALRKLEKDHTGIRVWPNKKQFLARLRDYFEVGENAFTLLNRAAGLKQLNSIDEIFRELVLDDHAAFDRAAEVANSFDDLSEIHQELETARKQQQSLLPIDVNWVKYQQRESDLTEKIALEALLPVWFAEQACQLWHDEVERLRVKLHLIDEKRKTLQNDKEQQDNYVNQCQQAYDKSGGENIELLKTLINTLEITCRNRAKGAQHYQRLAGHLSLPDALTEDALHQAQASAHTRLKPLNDEIEEKQQQVHQKWADHRALQEKYRDRQTEKEAVERRPDSNLPEHYQLFRSDLADALAVDIAELPFVAELVQVKVEEQAWRDVIERAIGGHRLRILVPAHAMKAALRWVNQRNNNLHVRLLEVNPTAPHPVFFADSFTHKLQWKEHRWLPTVQTLLAENDRHCVNSSDQLHSTPYAMTVQGLMSGKRGFFEKQDQKQRDKAWFTGFNNRDQLTRLNDEINQLHLQLVTAEQEKHHAEAATKRLRETLVILDALLALNFDAIDLPGAERQIKASQERLDNLLHPESDSAAAKQALDAAIAQQAELNQLLLKTVQQYGQQETSLAEAELALKKNTSIADVELEDAQRALCAEKFLVIDASQLKDIPNLEKAQHERLRHEINVIQEGKDTLGRDLVKNMSDAHRADTGALSEVGRELEDIPHYLARLQELTEEALPGKLKRFLEYLNRSSDEGVTQLLSHIEQEVLMIEERLNELNHTMSRVDFQPGRYLRLATKKVVHDSLLALQKAVRQLNAARFEDDEGETQYKALLEIIRQLRDACERNRTHGARALLDPRFRLTFFAEVVDRDSDEVFSTLTGSQGGSGGEKEIISSYVLTASLSYALCPNGSRYPLFGTIILDEAFSRSSLAVAGRIIDALKEFGLHAVFITPNKEIRLLRHHTRSAVVVHRRKDRSSMASLSWAELDHYRQKHQLELHEHTR